MTHPIHWPAEAIWEAVSPLLPGFTVEVVPQIDSTNTELMRRARAGQHEPVLLLAERQTAGRGRLGREWLSDAAQTSACASLTFSLGLPLAPADWSGLSLAVGVSVAESLSPAVGLKWPNDLWWQDRKLGGILIETASVGTQRYAVIGIGINIAAPAVAGAEAGGALRTPPAWLQAIEPGAQAPQILERLIAPLVGAIQTFEAQGFAPFRVRFAARDVLRDRSVVLSDGTQGTAQGVDAQGALQVRTADGLRAVTTADVSVRPVPTEETD